MPSRPRPRPSLPSGQLAFVGPGRCLSFEVLVDLLRVLPFTGLAQVLLDLLVDRRVHEERQDHRRRSVDRHRHRRCRRTEVEARVELLHVVDGGDRDTRVADLAVDVRAARAGPRRTASPNRMRSTGAPPAGQATGSGSGDSCARACPRPQTCVSGPRRGAGRDRRRPCRDRRPGRFSLLRKRSKFAPVPRSRRRDLGNLLVAQGLAVVVARDLAARAPCSCIARSSRPPCAEGHSRSSCQWTPA